MPIIDFHSHVLPGMDDGSSSSEMSLQMLQDAARQGVDIVVATPHFYAGTTNPERFLRHRTASLDRLFSLNAAGLPRLICGAEVAFFSGIGHADGLEYLFIEHTNLMLLEMPFDAWSGRDLKEVEMLVNRGIQPVIAHLERFYRFQKDKAIIPALLDMPVCVQINAGCLLNWRERRIPLQLFKNGQAHLLGSDCHNTDSRPQNLMQGRAVLQKKLGQAVLADMDTFGNRLLQL